MSAESTAPRRRPADADFAASGDVDAALEALRGDLKEKWRESVRICTTTEAALLAKLGRQLDSSFEDYAEDLQSLKVFLQKQIVLLVLPVNSGLIKDFSGGEHWASLYMAPRKGATLVDTMDRMEATSAPPKGVAANILEAAGYILRGLELLYKGWRLAEPGFEFIPGDVMRLVLKKQENNWECGWLGERRHVCFEPDSDCWALA